MAVTDEEGTNHTEEHQDESEDAINAKRKRTESHDSAHPVEDEVLKKLKPVEESSLSYINGNGSNFSHDPYSLLNAAPAAESGDGLMIEIAPDKVGQIIGSKGAIIQEIQMRSGAKAFVNQEFPEGVNRQLNLTGTPEQVKAASDLIHMILDQGPQAIHITGAVGGAVVTSVMDCTQEQVGKVIGTKGATIKELQSKSGARIQIDQDFPPDVPRKINMTGTASAVAIAAQLIQTVITSGAAAAGLTGAGGGFGGGGFSGGSHYGGGGGMMGGYGQPNMYGQPQMMMQPQFGGTGANGEVKQQMDVPKSIVGKIIGRGGETIGMIQRKSGARVQVDQNVPEGAPCKIMMSGSAQTLTAATALIQEIILSAPDGRQAFGNMMPTPVTMPFMGQQMPQQQGYGMPGAYGMPMQQMPQQFGYGGYPAQQQPMQQPYQQPQPQYGMPAAGGYQAYGATPAVAMPVQSAYSTGQYGQQPAVAPVAKAAVTPAVVWTEHKTDDGITYWYNASTGVSQWERPKSM